MKHRLGIAMAFTALLAGCPDAGEDGRRSRGEVGDKSLVAEVDDKKFVCTNFRPWRKDLDLPGYLSGEQKDESLDDATRDKRMREYVAAHEDTYTVCHQPLVDVNESSNRGTCKVCTQMLSDRTWQDKRVNHKPGGGAYDPEDPIQLTDEQQFTKTIEFRLKWVKEDYVTKADDQIASFKAWIASRNPQKLVTGYDASKNPAEPIIETDAGKIVDILAERAKLKGTFTKDEANPKVLPKFGLPPLAEPYVTCPKCTKPVYTTESRCWNCNTFYTLSHRDERNSIAEPHESLCPSCLQPVDPTLNYCDNGSCKNRFHRPVDREGPCWRCGGSHVCPECMGSGKGTGPVMGGDDCWLCGGKGSPGQPGFNGSCPECDVRGFTTYDGALPPGFKGDKRDTAPIKKDWRLKTGAAPAKGADKPAKGGDKPADEGDKGGEKAGGEEKDK